MLILKKPLTLQSVSALEILSDGLGEKICGNYQTFAASVTGEDLIHMTMQEPDIYVEIENNSPFLVDQQVHMDNRVRLELVNRLVNRLMLYSSPRFTYQDEVFVAAVLHKLGVTDVSTFMRQVKLHMEENRLAVSLINRYFAKGREFAYTVEHLLQNSFSDSRELKTVKKEYRSERYLHNDIFKRLMTAECSNTVYSYQNPVIVRESAAESFHTLEWMRQADRIQLSQFRENIYQQTNPPVFYDYFSYETKPLAVSELTRQKVIGRMSAAILENIVSLVSYTLQYEYGSTDVWKNYSRIFYGSSENALERFHYFQGQGTVGDVQLNAYTVRRNELVQDELHLTQLLEFVSMPDSVPEEGPPYEKMGQNIMLTMLENQNFQRQLVTELQTVQQVKAELRPDTYYLEERNEYNEDRNQFEAVYRILRQKRSENYFSPIRQGEGSDRQKDSLENGKALSLLAAIDEENALREHRGGEREEIGEKIRDMFSKEHDAGDGPPRIQAQESGWAVYELIHRYAQSGTDPDVPLMENRELLEQINKHNLYMKQLLDSKAVEKDTPRRVVVDRAQAREAALRALDHPEQVLREIYENAESERKIPHGIAAQIPGEIERILSATDAGTRSYYERLMGYRSDETTEAKPERGKECGDERNMIHKTTDGIHPQEYPEADRTVLTQKEQERQEDIREKIDSLLRWIESREHVYWLPAAMQTQETLKQIQVRQIQEQTADIQHRTDILNMEEMISSERQNTVHRQMVSVSRDIEKNVQMVHKTREQTNQEIVDEVLETIGNSSVSRQTVEEKGGDILFTQHQLEQIRNELTTQSREQITHTVERSMKTHIHELSDMVYLELERRLKNEQRRRGY